MKITRSKDKNGNTLAKVTTQYGSFTIQTNGNLPQIHRDFTGGKRTSLAADDVIVWVGHFGTDRQKKMLGLD